MLAEANVMEAAEPNIAGSQRIECVADSVEAVDKSGVLASLTPGLSENESRSWVATAVADNFFQSIHPSPSRVDEQGEWRQQGAAAVGFEWIVWNCLATTGWTIVDSR